MCGFLPRGLGTSFPLQKPAPHQSPPPPYIVSVHGVYRSLLQQLLFDPFRYRVGTPPSTSQTYASFYPQHLESYVDIIPSIHACCRNKQMNETIKTGRQVLESFNLVRHQVDAGHQKMRVCLLQLCYVKCHKAGPKRIKLFMIFSC